MPEENSNSEVAAQDTSVHSAVADYIEGHAHAAPRGSDDLLDIHVGNPLEKIVSLLTEIKKQKAFSFTLKGSLGIAGVALALGVFGVFGGNQLLCSHGAQTHVGVIRILQYGESPKSDAPFIGPFIDKIAPQPAKRRVVLVKNGNSTLALPYSKYIDFSQYEGQEVAATGDYNSCNQILGITDPAGIEPYEQ